MNSIEVNKKITKKNIEELSKDNTAIMDRQKDVLKWIDSYLNKDDKIFDIGTRDGSLLEILKERGYEKISGCDISEDAIELCKKKNLNVFIQDINELNKNEKYDFITATHVLEHVENPKQVLKRLFEILNWNGRLFIEIPIQKNEDPELWGHFHVFNHEDQLIDMLGLFITIKQEKQKGNSKKPWFRILLIKRGALNEI